jgi:hypothetical protein
MTLSDHYSKVLREQREYLECKHATRLAQAQLDLLHEDMPQIAEIGVNLEVESRV